MNLEPGKKIGSWDSNLGKADITVKSKIGENYKSEDEAVKAAAASGKQAAIVEKDGKFSTYEIDDGALFDDLDINEFASTNANGKAAGVISFVGDDGKKVHSGKPDSHEVPKFANEKEELEWAKSLIHKVETFHHTANKEERDAYTEIYDKQQSKQLEKDLKYLVDFFALSDKVPKFANDKEELEWAIGLQEKVRLNHIPTQEQKDAYFIAYNKYQKANSVETEKK